MLDTIEYAVKPELNVEWWRVFDLFDTVELLQILLVDRNTSLPIGQTTKTFMLIFGSTSLFFPVFSLWELQACRKIPSETAGSNNSSDNKRKGLVFRVRIVSKMCQLFFVNVAFLTIRLVLFFDFNLDASVFVAKNAIAIIVGVIEIISACRGKIVKRSQESRICSLPGFTGSEESLALSSALQQKKTREHEHSKTQTHLRENTVGLASCDDSKLAFSSDISARKSNPLSSSWQQPTTKEEKRSNTQNLWRENLAFGDHLYPSRLRTTTKPEESFSEMTNFRREKPAAINPRAHQNIQSNTRRREQNPEPSAFLDHISDDNDTREIHLGFTSFSTGPKSFSEERETRPETIRQYRRPGQRKDNRRTWRNMHTPASTVWNTRK